MKYINADYIEKNVENNKSMLKKMIKILIESDSLNAHNLYKYDFLSDVVYIINDKEYKLHNEVIIEKSMFFKLMFDNKENFKNDNKIDIKISDKHIEDCYIKNIIEYLYTSNSDKILKHDSSIFKYYLISKYLDLDLTPKILVEIKNICKKIKIYELGIYLKSLNIEIEFNRTCRRGCCIEYTYYENINKIDSMFDIGNLVKIDNDVYDKFNNEHIIKLYEKCMLNIIDVDFYDILGNDEIKIIHKKDIRNEKFFEIIRKIIDVCSKIKNFGISPEEYFYIVDDLKNINDKQNLEKRIIKV